jgi:hypothetical protein
LDLQGSAKAWITLSAPLYNSSFHAADLGCERRKIVAASAAQDQIPHYGSRHGGHDNRTLKTRHENDAFNAAPA